MRRYNLLIACVIVFADMSCSQDRKSIILEWGTKEIEYEGFPLLLRKPVYDDIWLSQKKYGKLLVITHMLTNVRANGLPEARYNDSLAAFDHDVIGITKDDNCLLVLIETFGGKRRYYYYTTENFDSTLSIQRLQAKYRNHKISSENRHDLQWTFFKDYPVKLD